MLFNVEQFPLEPVTSTALSEEVLVELMKKLELTTPPPFATIRLLLDPPLPRITSPSFVHNDPDPETVTEFPKELVVFPMVAEPLATIPPLVTRSVLAEESRLWL